MKYNICTWNMQGVRDLPARLKTISGLIKSDRYNVICLQEAGSLKDYADENAIRNAQSYSAYLKLHVERFSQCGFEADEWATSGTVDRFKYVIVPLEYRQNRYILCLAEDTEDHSNRLSVGMLFNAELDGRAIEAEICDFPPARRPIVHIQPDDNLHVFSMHAVANARRSLIQLPDILRQMGIQPGDFLLGADFNCEPSAAGMFSENLNGGGYTYEIAENDVRCRLVTTGQKTQGTGNQFHNSKELDYFAAGENMYAHMHSVTVKKISASCSDHAPVMLQFEL